MRCFIILPLVFLLNTSPYHPEKGHLIATYTIHFKAFKDSERISKATAHLYITDTSSVFIDPHLVKIIEITELGYKGEEKNQELSKIGGPVPKLKYIIEKKVTANFLTYSEESAPGQYIAYEEEMMSPGIWQIRADTATIAGLPAQKATCPYGGRSWTAWFSPEVPVSEGPYKFSGLPGLIVKLESADGEYKFILSGLERRHGLLPLLPKRPPVKKEKFKEMRLMYYDHMIPPGVQVNGTINGASMNREETIRFLKNGELNRNTVEK